MHRLFAISVVAIGCQGSTAEQPPQQPQQPAPQQPAKPAVAKPTEVQPFGERAALLRAIQVDSLILTPIVTTAPPKEDLDVVTLDEAFEKKLVAIKEKQDDTVNQLTLTNKSDRPMFLLAGEVIIGGKQDRIIGANTIITAKSTLVVPVFCVEHGRWSEGETGRVFTSGKALAHGRLRGKASFEGQSEVWSEVATKNGQRKVENSTGTYRNVARQQTNSSLASQVKRIDEAIAQISAADRANMIGFVVSLDGKVGTVDMFDSPRLFRKLENKLVRSYLTESVDVPATAANKPPSPTEIKSFITDADKAKEEPSYENDSAATQSFKGMKSAKSRVMYKPSKTGKAVYESYQAK
jgi:hypothetical protein